MAELRRFLDEFWTDSLDRLQRLADPAREISTDREKPTNRERARPMTELMREVVVDASPATIFPYLTRPELHLRWMGTEAELDARAGGAYRVNVGGGPPVPRRVRRGGPRREGRVHLRVGRARPPHSRRLHRVEITLTPDGDKTRVRLVHRGLPDDAVGDHEKGWDHYLGRLAVAASGGDPGPDRASEGG